MKHRDKMKMQAKEKSKQMEKIIDAIGKVQDLEKDDGLLLKLTKMMKDGYNIMNTFDDHAVGFVNNSK